MANGRLRSMTGYGEAERDTPFGRIRAEIRTVNHRYLNLQLKTPPGFDRFHPELERRLRGRFARGNVTVTLILDRSTATEDEAPVRVDVPRARAYRDALRALQQELDVQGGVDLQVLTGFRDIFQLADRDRSAPGLDPELFGEVVDRAAEAVVAMREDEAGRLEGDLSSRLDRMDVEIAGIESRAPGRLVEERDRLREAVRQLLDGGAEVDEDRVAREIAYLAERWDIHEEIVRFRSHLHMFRETLRAGGADGVGKRLGFIAQELLREANTIGSKANDAEIAARVVQLKEEIDRLREQLENLE